MFLQDPKGYAAKRNTSCLTYITKQQVIEESVKLLNRLYGKNKNNETATSNDTTLSANNILDISFEPPTFEDFESKLNAALLAANTINKPETGPVLSSSNVKKEFLMYEATLQNTEISRS